MPAFPWLRRRRVSAPAATAPGKTRKHPPSLPGSPSRHTRQLDPLPQEQQRTYLEHAPYLLPKDEQEDARLRFQHYVLQHAFGNAYLAPLPADLHSILDVGCGTGTWLLEMTRQFPRAHLLGLDLVCTSLPQPLPETCLFVQADLLQGLPFPTGQFDFTHQRLLVGAIPALRWPEVVRELVRVTRVGGWVECLEVGATVQPMGRATERLLSWVRETSLARGIDVALVSQLGSLLTGAGCQGVETHELPVPLGAWAGRGGELLKLDTIRVFQALRPRTTTPAEQVEAMLAEAEAEWEQQHACYVFHAAYGRRAEP